MKSHSIRRGWIEPDSSQDKVMVKVHVCLEALPE